MNSKNSPEHNHGQPDPEIRPGTDPGRVSAGGQEDLQGTAGFRNSAKAIVVLDGRLLVTRHVDELGNWYLLPGGGQRFGETLVEAVMREALEETGARLRVGALKVVREYIGRNHEFADSDGHAHQLELMFECELDGDYRIGIGSRPDASQVGVAWLPIRELEQYRLYPKALIGILKQGLAGLTAVYLGDVN